MSEEPQFFRLNMPSFPRSPWVAYFSLSPCGALRVRMTAYKANARIFVTPSELELDSLRRRIGPVELHECSFNEWVEQDAHEKHAEVSS